MDEIIAYLQKFDAIRLSEDGDSIVIRTIDRQEPNYDERDVLSQLNPIVQKSVHELGINQLFDHQANAIEKSLQGQDVILESPTASGKTLSFLIPMINTLTNDPMSYALMIYPMKAISRDQRRQLRNLYHDEISSWIYDGDTEKVHRTLIKSTPPRILFTNPEMLHMSFLGWSDQWEQKFLKNLKFIVIDEIHEYRGYFGTNVALLLRRLFHKLKSLQSRPQLFLATATCANPLEHAKRLTGRENFVLISASENGMRPRRHFLFINPRIPNYRFSDIFQLRIANAGLACLSLPQVKPESPNNMTIQEKIQEYNLKGNTPLRNSIELSPKYHAQYSGKSIEELEQMFGVALNNDQRAEAGKLLMRIAEMKKRTQREKSLNRFAKITDLALLETLFKDALEKGQHSKAGSLLDRIAELKKTNKKENSDNYSILVFCPSRKFAEDVYRTTIKHADKWNINKDIIKTYRSGYTVKEREDIEEGLRNGLIKLVFSTNALELGIDIGQLDIIILAGFPDNLMSAWQRIGRAGRSWNKDAIIIFYAMNNVVDEFYASNIDAFLNKPLDHITIGISNEELIGRHIPYLLHESSGNLDHSDKEIIGNEFYAKALQLVKDTKPLKNIRGPNYQALSIRGESGSIHSLICDSKEIGTMSDIQVFREAYIGAIYKHIDRSYKVIGHGNNTVFIENADYHLTTKPMFWTTATVEEIYDGKRYDEAISIYYGKLTIFENFEGYKLIDDSNDMVINEERSQKARRTIADAFWLKVEKPDIKKGITALEQIFRIGSLFIIPSDRYDSGTFSRIDEQEIYYYENYVGGIGLAEKAFEVFGEIIGKGIDIADSCQYCRLGCARCIHPPGLKDTKSINKIEGIKLAKFILWLSKTTNIEIFNPQLHRWQKQDSSTTNTSLNPSDLNT